MLEKIKKPREVGLRDLPLARSGDNSCNKQDGPEATRFIGDPGGKADEATKRKYSEECPYVHGFSFG
jgi:hypothetical protein